MKLLWRLHWIFDEEYPRSKWEEGYVRGMNKGIILGVNLGAVIVGLVVVLLQI